MFEGHELGRKEMSQTLPQDFTRVAMQITPFDFRSILRRSPILHNAFRGTISGDAGYSSRE